MLVHSYLFQVFYLPQRRKKIGDHDYEVSLDLTKRSKIKLSPIPQDLTANPIKFTFPADKPEVKLEKSKDVQSEGHSHNLQTPYEELNYDEVLSKGGQTVTAPHLEQALNDLINQDEDNEIEQENQDENEKQPHESEEKVSGHLSSSQAQEEDNPINPIKDFATKTSRIFADSESSKLNSSVVSQKGIDPFMITNSSVMSTYLYKPPFLPNSAATSNVGSRLPSPSKASSSAAAHSTAFRTTTEFPVSLRNCLIYYRLQ